MEGLSKEDFLEKFLNFLLNSIQSFSRSLDLDLLKKSFNLHKIGASNLSTKFLLKSLNGRLDQFREELKELHSLYAEASETIDLKPFSTEGYERYSVVVKKIRDLLSFINEAAEIYDQYLSIASADENQLVSEKNKKALQILKEMTFEDLQKMIDNNTILMKF